MNVEMIINLLIVFFVIYSVVKRAQNVTKKAGEIKGQPSGGKPAGSQTPADRTLREATDRRPPKMLRDILDEFEKQVIPKPPVQPSHIPPYEPKRSIQSTFGEVAESVESGWTEAGDSEEVFEDSLEDIFPETVEPVRKRVSEAVPAIQYAQPVSSLSFDGPDVVRAIIMSEILAPPVSMR